MPKKSPPLLFFFAENNFQGEQTILVVTLVGPLARENAPIFQECVREIALSRSKWIIVNFRDVSAESHPEFLPLFRELHKTARLRGAILRFSGLHPALRPALLELGVHHDEIVNNLTDAFDHLAILRKAA